MDTTHASPGRATTASAPSRSRDGRAVRFGVDGTGLAVDAFDRAIEFDAEAHEHAESKTTRIVVGLDGSEQSLDALRRAVRMATGSEETTVRAVVAWHNPSFFGTMTMRGWSPKTEAEQILDEAVAVIFPGDVPEWFTGTTHQGRAAEALIAESSGAEMLIIGSRGSGGFTGLRLGSVSSACAAHARCPVLIMRDDATL